MRFHIDKLCGTLYGADDAPTPTLNLATWQPAPLGVRVGIPLVFELSRVSKKGEMNEYSTSTIINDSSRD